jgi:glycosyltransferase involved in cell wall biosynthesis
MRILHWAHSLLNENGGLEEFVAALGVSLLNLGHEIALVTEKPLAESIASPDRYPRAARLHTIDLARNVSTSALRRTWDELEAFVTDFSPDVIHLHSVGRGDIALLGALKRRHHIPIVFTAHSPLTSPGLLPQLAPLGDFITRAACPSQFMFDMVGTYLPSWKDIRVLIRNGVDPNLQGGTGRIPHQIYASGRHVSDKGFSTLIAAMPIVMNRVPHARLILAGAGAETKTLKNLARIYGVGEAIEWPGWIAQSDARRLVGNSAVACVPSIWTEPFGLVAAEASMEGTPVVATKSGALPEIVVSGLTGYTVAPGDVAATGVALATLLMDAELREQLGRAAREHTMRHFDLTATVDGYVSLYEDAL